MLDLKDRLIVALDVDGINKAKRFIDILYPTVRLFKVGSQLFTAAGPEAVRMVGAKGGKVFLDLKFFDIPKTVLSATASAIAASSDAGAGLKERTLSAVFMMTVHTMGGLEMLRAAVRGAAEKSNELKIVRPFIVGVTVLTSETNTKAIQEKVLQAAAMAKEAGLDGVVCSVLEAPMIRKEFGDKFIIVTPGIRPAGSKADDQRRTATAGEAIKAGSDFLVVGRPILESKDPLQAVKDLV